MLGFFCSKLPPIRHPTETSYKGHAGSCSYLVRSHVSGKAVSARQFSWDHHPRLEEKRENPKGQSGGTAPTPVKPSFAAPACRRPTCSGFSASSQGLDFFFLLCGSVTRDGGKRREFIWCHLEAFIRLLTENMEH